MFLAINVVVFSFFLARVNSTFILVNDFIMKLALIERCTQKYITLALVKEFVAIPIVAPILSSLPLRNFDGEKES
jgi:hypothetical protein